MLGINPSVKPEDAESIYCEGMAHNGDNKL